MKDSTTLHIAAEHNYEELIEILISHGAEINAKTYDVKDALGVNKGGGLTPLHYAAMFNSREVGEKLIENGSNIDGRDAINIEGIKEI